MSANCFRFGGLRPQTPAEALPLNHTRKLPSLDTLGYSRQMKIPGAVTSYTKLTSGQLMSAS